LFFTRSAIGADDSAFQRAEEFRLARTHFDWPSADVASPAMQSRFDDLAKRPVPANAFRSYLPRLLKDKKAPLTAEQRTALEQARDQFKPEKARLHDEYNVARMGRMICGWRYAKASDDEAPALKRELEQWLALYLRCVADHEASTDRESRAYWAILTPAQQREVAELKWERYASTNPGHSRAFFTAKIMRKAMGKLDAASSERFDREAAKWEASHNDILARYQASEQQMTRLQFYYDTCDPALFQYALPKVLAVTGELFRHEPEAQRALYQQLDPARRAEWNQKIDAAIADTRATMLEKYSDQAAGLLKILGETPANGTTNPSKP
jgi:hypothetical protein